MRYLPLIVLLAGCMTKPNDSLPMPTCSTDCAQKMAAAKTWFLAHSYTIKRDEPERLVAGSLRAVVNIEHKPPALEVLVVCLDTLGMLSITSGCEDIYTVKYDVIQAMNATAPAQP